MRSFPYVLCIIDMQWTFTASHNPLLIRKVVSLIKKAIFDKAYICVAQYKYMGRTQERLIELIRKYPYKSYCSTYNNDKGMAIYRRMSRDKVQMRGSHFKVCGVNTDACVQATIRGLRTMFPGIDIYIERSACNTCSAKEMADAAISGLLSYPTVFVTP